MPTLLKSNPFANKALLHSTSNLQQQRYRVKCICVTREQCPEKDSLVVQRHETVSCKRVEIFEALFLTCHHTFIRSLLACV